MTSQDHPDWTQANLPAVITVGVDDLFAVLSENTSGASELIAAVASKRIVVRALFLVADGAVDVKFQSDGTPTDITGLVYCAENGGIVLPYQASGWFRTISGEALDINLSAAVAVGGAIVYGTV